VSSFDKAEELTIMKKMDVSRESCSECGGQLKKKYVAQAFERGGITVKLTGIAALVCSKCGEIYFQPGGSEKVVEAATLFSSLPPPRSSTSAH
jgi:YgiT-type zinc finger domain-containing protein